MDALIIQNAGRRLKQNKLKLFITHGTVNGTLAGKRYRGTGLFLKPPKYKI